MSSRYIITFSKKGYIKYISHLDMVRLFERVFKRGQIRLDYSQGFNPHPKLVFAQPLSLGYTAESEQVEIETKEPYEIGFLMDTMNRLMPEGIEIIKIKKMPEYRQNQGKATIASKVCAAVYTIEFPKEAAPKGTDGAPTKAKSPAELCREFMSQESIITLKKQKKKKDLKEVDIKPMILELKAFERFSSNKDTGEPEDKIIMEAKLAQGSSANLSPELLIPAFIEFSGFTCKRSDVEVTRNCLIYEK